MNTCNRLECPGCVDKRLRQNSIATCYRAPDSYVICCLVQLIASVLLATFIFLSPGQLRESVLQLVDSMTMGFIWHREAFALSVAMPFDGNLEPHLFGEQVFGGNVSDEWFVCYLLFTITSTFTE